jgi:hypothetical protein
MSAATLLGIEMQAMPIKARAKVQTIVRIGTDANRTAMMAALGSHHANKLTRLLPTQSLERGSDFGVQQGSTPS